MFLRVVIIIKYLFIFGCYQLVDWKNARRTNHPTTETIPLAKMTTLLRLNDISRPLSLFLLLGALLLLLLLVTYCTQSSGFYLLIIINVSSTVWWCENCLINNNDEKLTTSPVAVWYIAHMVKGCQNSAYTVYLLSICLNHQDELQRCTR